MRYILMSWIGDGVKLLDEECDDGNLMSRDGCSVLCKIESGYIEILS